MTFVAIRDIIVNEEITFDYAMRNFGVDYFPKHCMYGSERCRGKITGWKNLSFKTKIVHIREATQEELQAGIVN